MNNEDQKMTTLSTSIISGIIKFLENLEEVSEEMVYTYKVEGTNASLYLSTNRDLIIGTDKIEHSGRVFYIGYLKS